MCGHTFCHECLHQCFERDVRCPLCRRVFVSVRGVLHLNAWLKLWREAAPRRCMRVLTPQNEETVQ